MKTTITTWADGFGRWYGRADFDSGLGNTPDGEAVKFRALKNLKRAIRCEIVIRNSSPVARLKYEVHDNKVDSMNRLWSLTVREVW